MSVSKSTSLTAQARVLAVAALAAWGLGGCVEQAAQMSPSGEAHQSLAKLDGMNFSAATVAFVSVSGAPDTVQDSFQSALADAAKSRDIVVKDADSAHYLVRGYLNATPTQGGAEVEYVWDVFGPDKRRAFRLNDVVKVPGAGDDAWAVVTPAALASVAAKSADDLAAFLSRSPEAKPSAAATVALN